MESTLDTELLAGMLKTKRGTQGLRAIAEEIGSVSFATLSRIEQGRIPDVDTFIRICKWLEVSTETFILSSSTKAVSSKDRIVAHLRAEKELSKEHVNMILNMIDLAYNSK
ncbi:helix-turn-helix domain-containing protein [Chryseobacterium sp. FH1]|uniref:helix-turn-helix domain-containing protein n=1 Tax=Chryseobacterium sp. FH1 TaxID=1233951 RepID=UPI000691F8B6|nr:helix-turn-helix transcriptional regulator [Chryseobacterium sp. FH1]